MRSNKDKNWELLLTPSWVVNLVAITASIIVTVVTIVLSTIQSSGFRQEIFNAQANSPQTTPAVYQSVTSYIAGNSLFGAAPLFVVWACIGLVIYYFAMAIARSFHEVAELRDEFGYVHVSRRSLLRQALLHLGVRALAIIGWFAFIKLTLSILLPYALAAANIAAQRVSFASLGYTMLAIAVLYAILCIHAIFLRLIALRPRLFGAR